MKIQFFCPRWGSENLSWDVFCKKVKDAGYDGVEGAIPFDTEAKNEILAALKKHDLLLLGQYYQSFEKDFQAHKASYQKHLENIVSMKPVKIDSQTGKDYFNAAQIKELFEIASKISIQSGIPIAHETHRNKSLFAAHITKKILEENPDMRITADFSHWCNVAESLLEDQKETVMFACTKAIHIHARVGHQEGPQVSDPRAPEWKSQLDAHLVWWDSIVENNRKNKAETMTISPEFGPPPYLTTLPYTNMPIANQWEINVYIMNMLRKRYANN